VRNFDVWLDTESALDVVRARAFLGVVRAMKLDAELSRIRARLREAPESGAKVWVRGKWLDNVRRIPLSDVPYRLFYRLNLKDKRVVIFSIRHNSRRNPRM
jgi:plasmid stabilization system protein ParE